MAARFPVLLELLRAGNVDSSGSNGVGRGEGKWMFVRSGREPPVLCVAGISVVVFSWSADGKMLNKGERKKRQLSLNFSLDRSVQNHFQKREVAIYRKIYGIFGKPTRGVTDKGTLTLVLAYLASIQEEIQCTMFFLKDLNALLKDAQNLLDSWNFT